MLNPIYLFIISYVRLYRVLTCRKVLNTQRYMKQI